MITKNDLDTKICDYYYEDGFSNTETFREFIVNSEKEFEMENQDLDNMVDEDLDKYMEFLDYLWEK